MTARPVNPLAGLSFPGHMTTRKPKPSKAANRSKRSRGRPSDYRPELCETVEKLALLGLTDEQMADVIGKPIGTFNRWKADHAEFREAIKRGKTPADANMAQALFKRGTGFEWDEQQAIKVKEIKFDPNTGRKVSETERVEIVTVHRVAPPDTAAGIFWVCNRQKDLWRQRQEVTGANGKPLFGDQNLDEVRETVQGKLDRIAAKTAARAVAGKP